MVKIGLEKIDIQEEVTVEALLDSSATGLVMSSEFIKKQGFKLKRIEQPIYMRNVDGLFNKKNQSNIWQKLTFTIKSIERKQRQM